MSVFIINEGKINVLFTVVVIMLSLDIAINVNVLSITEKQCSSSAAV